MSPPHQFHPAARILHWIMAAAIVAMLFIGVGMASTVSGARTSLLPVHQSLGVVLLALTAVRLGVRLARRAPPLPADMPAWQRRAAGASQVVLYALMFAIPIVGWAMLSAGGLSGDAARRGQLALDRAVEPDRSMRRCAALTPTSPCCSSASSSSTSRRRSFTS